MGWKVKRRERYALIEVDEVNSRVHRGTFHIGPRHVRHHATKEFIEHTYVENPEFASEQNCRVFVQCSNIAVEVYDFYNKLFDPDYENVSVYDERFEVQYLFKEPDTWRSADYYNPRIEVIPLEDGVDIKKVFDTDYGAETLEITYTVRTGARLKHTIVFTNKTAEQRTFRVVMKFSGITSDKVKHGQIEEQIIEEKHIVTPFMFFGEDNQHLKLSEYLWSLGEVDEETGEWSPTTLKDIVLDVHAQGCKVDIIIGNYVLAENEGLEIDPDSDTFYVGGGTDDASEQGDGTFNRTHNYVYVQSYPNPSSSSYYCAGFRFRNVTIPQGTTVTAAKFSGYVSTATYDDIKCVIYGNDVDNTLDFNNNPHIINTGDRPRTAASVSWIANNLGAGWKDKTGLEGIVEEVVGRDGWSSGNAIALLFIANIDVETLIYFRTYEYDYLSELEVTWEAEPVDYFQTIEDILGMADALPSPIGAYKKSVSDILGMVESSPLVASFHLTASDQLGFLDTTLPRADFKQPITDQLGMLDTTATVKGLYQVIIESLDMIDAVAPRSDLKVEAIEVLGLLDTVEGRSALKQAITEILGLLESTAPRGDLKQVVTEHLAMLDTAASRGDYKKAITEILGMVESLEWPWPGVIMSVLVKKLGLGVSGKTRGQSITGKKRE